MVRVRPTKATNIHELAAKRGANKNAPLYVDLSDSLTVGVRLRNVTSMFALGILPEPLMEAAMKIGKRSEGKEMNAAEIKEAGELQDAVCAAIIVDPPYAALAEVTENGDEVPVGKLALSMLSDEEIGACFHLIYKGVDSWDNFREELQRRSALETLHSDGNETERSDRLDTDPAF